MTVERPLRIEGADPNRAYKAAEIKKLKENGEQNETALNPSSRRSTSGARRPDPLHGLFEVTINGKPAIVEYEPDTDLRDTEQIPLQEEGGIEAFLRREVLPYAPDAWYQPDSVKVGYEISFTPLLLQAAAHAYTGGNPGRYCGAGGRRRRGCSAQDYWRVKGMIVHGSQALSAMIQDSGVEWLGEVPAHWEVYEGWRKIAEPARKGTSVDTRRMMKCPQGFAFVSDTVTCTLQHNYFIRKSRMPFMNATATTDKIERNTRPSSSVMYYLQRTLVRQLTMI